MEGKTPWTNPANWRRTNKKQYQIKACVPPIGTNVYNQLEDCRYQTNQQKMVVLTGTRGEQWTIDLAKLCKTYTLPDGTPLSEGVLWSKHIQTPQGPVVKPFNIRSKTGTLNWCFHLPAGLQLPVKTSWGETLLANRPGVPHGNGDWLVCGDKGGQPDLSDVWVVNGEVFPDTYNMQGLTGPQPMGVTSAKSQNRDGANSRPTSDKLVGAVDWAKMAARLGKGDISPQEVQLLIRYRKPSGEIATSNMNLCRVVLDIDGENYVFSGDEAVTGLAISVKRGGFYRVTGVQPGTPLGSVTNAIWAAIPNASELAANGPSVKFIEELRKF